MTKLPKESLLTLADICGNLLLVGSGGLLAYLSHRHAWLWGAMSGAIAGLLITSTVLRNRSARRLIEASQRLIQAQEEVIEESCLCDLTEANFRLTDVALSAVALMTTIEHGMTPDLRALKRDLSAVGEFRTSRKANGSARP